MGHTEALIDTISLLNKHDMDFKNVCEVIIKASLYWTGADELNNPELKTMRTLARFYLEDPDYFITLS
ncbi:MAG: hypothetical protein DRI97_03920 [Bacteroidetes bacterium]|nr:MAG: hypothetical protein DRQ42_00435 [Gammaproteobacteria bacterium]RLD58102.1 MAG: hypothetical protein DRI97_03920 [Bacteroidota bacterium]